MITAHGQMGGRPAIVLGLSRENVTRLMAGQPILVSPAQTGGRAIVIVGGETEDTILSDLTAHGLVGPSTTVNDNR